MIFYFICLLYVVEWEVPASWVKLIHKCNHVLAMRDLLHTGELLSRSIVQRNWYDIRTLSTYTYYITVDSLLYAFSVSNITYPFIFFKFMCIDLIQYSSIILNIHVYIIYIYMATCLYMYLFVSHYSVCTGLLYIGCSIFSSVRYRGMQLRPTMIIGFNLISCFTYTFIKSEPSNYSIKSCNILSNAPQLIVFLPCSVFP